MNNTNITEYKPPVDTSPSPPISAMSAVSLAASASPAVPVSPNPSESSASEDSSASTESFVSANSRWSSASADRPDLSGLAIYDLAPDEEMVVLEVRREKLRQRIAAIGEAYDASHEDRKAQWDKIEEAKLQRDENKNNDLDQYFEDRWQLADEEDYRMLRRQDDLVDRMVALVKDKRAIEAKLGELQGEEEIACEYENDWDNDEEPDRLWRKYLREGLPYGL